MTTISPSWIFGDECLEHCAMTLIGSDGAKTTVHTDDFGDFWFERLQPGKYSLHIGKEGYQPRIIDGIDATTDLNLGDIELHKESRW